MTCALNNVQTEAAEYPVRLLNMDERPCIGRLSFKKLPDRTGLSERGHVSSILRAKRPAMIECVGHLSEAGTKLSPTRKFT